MAGDDPTEGGKLDHGPKPQQQGAANGTTDGDQQARDAARPQVHEWRIEFRKLTGLDPSSQGEQIEAWQRERGLEPTGKIRRPDIEAARMEQSAGNRAQLVARLRGEMEHLIAIGIRDAGAGHEAQSLHMDENRGVAGTLSDFFNDVTPPILMMWGNARRSLEGARRELQAGQLRNAHIHLQEGYQELADAQHRWQAYIGETITGAERTAEGLRIVRDGAIAVEVGLLTGGLAYAAHGAAAGATVLGVGAATATAAASRSKLGEATRGTLGEVVDAGVLGNLKLAGYGIAGMVIGIGHGLKQIPHGLVAAGKTLIDLFTDPRQFVADLEKFQATLEQLWENRDALWSAFENPPDTVPGHTPSEKQAFLIGEFVGHIESNLIAIEATRAVGRGLPEKISGSVPKFGTAVAKGAGGGAARLIPVVTSKLVKLRLDAIKKLIALGALDPALLAACGQAAGGAIGAGGGLDLGPLFRITPSGAVAPAEGRFKGQSVSYGDPRSKHTKVATFSMAELKDALKRKPREGALARLIKAIKDGEKEYGSQLSKEATDRYGALVKNALEKGVEKGAKIFADAGEEIGIDVETGKPTRFYRLDGAPNGTHIIPVPKMPH